MAWGLVIKLVVSHDWQTGSALRGNTQVSLFPALLKGFLHATCKYSCHLVEHYVSHPAAVHTVFHWCCVNPSGGRPSINSTVGNCALHLRRDVNIYVVKP